MKTERLQIQLSIAMPNFIFEFVVPNNNV